MKKRVFFLLVAALMMPWAMKAQVNLSVHRDSTKSACDSYTWSVNGVTYTESTVVTYIDDDTLYILDLTINPSVTNVVTEPVSGGCTYQWGDTTYNVSGTYTQTFKTTKGCDSTVTINLTIGGSASVTRDIIACDTFAFRGLTYRESGVFVVNDTVSNPNCDSIITLNLTIRAVEEKSYDTTVTGCEYVTWAWDPLGGNESDYSEKIVYRSNTELTSDEFSRSDRTRRNQFHPRFANRCYDSTVYLHIVVKKNGVFPHVAQDCDIHSFYYTFTQIDTIHVIDTVNNISYDSIVDNSIDTTLYYTFSKSDTLRFAGKAVNGCDSLVAIKVTLYKNPVVTIEGDLRVTPGSNCRLVARSDQSNTRFTWQDGSHDTVYTRNNVTENFDIYVEGKNNSTGCKHTSYVTVLVNEGIENADDNAISVYPNPTSAIININSNDAVKSITVFNIAGQQVITSNHSNSVDLRALSNGKYIIRVDLENGKVATRTVVVSK